MIWVPQWWIRLHNPPPEDDDDDFLDSDNWDDRTPEGLDCPDTEPTSPGALDDNN